MNKHILKILVWLLAINFVTLLMLFDSERFPVVENQILRRVRGLISKEARLINLIKEAPDAQLDIFGLSQAGRRQGLFLIPFEIDEIQKLERWQEPFIIYLQGEGYVVVKEVRGSSLSYLDLEGIKQRIEDFRDKWDGKIISFPPPVEYILSHLAQEKPENETTFVALYGIHDEPGVFEELEPQLDEIMSKRSPGETLLMLLEFLPPSPEALQAQFPNLSLRQAFEEFKKMTQTFLNGVANGQTRVRVTLPDGRETVLSITTPFKKELIDYLAEHRIQAIIEDISFEDWLAMEQEFLPLESQMLRALSSGDFERYLNLSSTYYVLGYDINSRRDDKLLQQMRSVVREKHPQWLMMIRGTAHFGIEEGLLDFFGSVQVGSYSRHPFDSPHLPWILERSGVKISQNQLQKYYRDRIFYDALFSMTIHTIKFSERSRIVRMILDRITLKELENFTKSLPRWQEENEQEIKTLEQLGRIFFSWLLGKHKIKTDELRYFFRE